MFENPVANSDPAESFLKGFQVTSEATARRDQLQKAQAQIDLEKQKFLQNQAVMTLGQEAARTGDPRTLSMFTAVNPEGGKALKDNIQSHIKEGMGRLQAIREAKITDRPAIYKMNIAKLKEQNPYFDASQYPAEYSPEVNSIIDADLVSGKDLDRQYSLQETDNGLVKFESKTGQVEPTDLKVYVKPPTSVININNAAENQEQKGIGDIRADRYKTALTQGDAAQQQLDILGTMKQAILDPNAAQGALSDIKQNTKKYAQAFGFDPQGMSSEAIIESLGNKLALQLRNPTGEDGGLTGNTSDRDVKFLVSAVPSKDKTQSQNLALIDIGMRKAQRGIEISKMADEYVAKNNSYRGFDNVKKQYIKTHPLYNEEEIKNLESQLKNPNKSKSNSNPYKDLSDDEIRKKLGGL